MPLLETKTGIGGRRVESDCSSLVLPIPAIFRSDHGSRSGCKGVDANRNWGFHWAEGWASSDKCDNTYHGPEAFSEIETVNVRDYLAAMKGQFIMFNTLHSYSQLILLPWSWTKDAPDDYDWMFGIASRGIVMHIK